MLNSNIRIYYEYILIIDNRLVRLLSIHSSYISVYEISQHVVRGVVSLIRTVCLS